MTGKSWVLIASLIILATCDIQQLSSVTSQYVPVSKRYPGLDIPGTNPKVHIQLVYDVTCPDSVNFDQKWRQVQASLASNHPGMFSYRYSLHALPLRIYSFKVTQAINYASQQKGDAEGLKMLRHFFDNYKNWCEEQINTTPLSKLMDTLAKEASSASGLPEDDLRKQVAHFSKSDYNTRQWVKYAMGTLHAGSAPTLLVNGARLDKFASMSADDLTDYLSQLI